MNEAAVHTLAYWINEREAIRQTKEAGAPQPWTDDTILATYRFCNVHRDDDRVTRFIKGKWLPSIPSDRRVLAAVAGRLFNRPTVLAAITEPLLSERWAPNTLHALRQHRAAGLRTFNAAYIITTCGVKMDKLTYCVNVVLKAVAKLRQPTKQDTLASYATQLTSVHGLNTFLAAQAVADLRKFHPLNKAKDLDTFALSGPGSRRGLNRIMGRPITSAWNEPDWLVQLHKLRENLLPRLEPYVGELHCQDLQNCLCEFDKYMRTTTGEGKPKQRYTPHLPIEGIN